MWRAAGLGRGPTASQLGHELAGSQAEARPRRQRAAEGQAVARQG
jgi:hypothetical protein